jgi:DNA polymerase I-like protein with 3'-5' exonuclease and polymerase domains
VGTLILQACAVLDLADVLDEELARIDSSSLFSRIELPVVRALSEMEIAGIAVDRARLTGILNGFEDEVASDGRIHRTFHRTEAAPLRHPEPPGRVRGGGWLRRVDDGSLRGD